MDFLSAVTLGVTGNADCLVLNSVANVEMCDFIHDGSTVNRPNNAQEIYLKELGSESPMLVRLIMKSIHKQNKREVKHIGCKRFGIHTWVRFPSPALFYLSAGALFYKAFRRFFHALKKAVKWIELDRVKVRHVFGCKLYFFPERVIMKSVVRQEGRKHDYTFKCYRTAGPVF